MAGAGGCAGKSVQWVDGDLIIQEALATEGTETRSNWIRAVSEIPRMFPCSQSILRLFKMALKGSCKKLCSLLS